MPSPREQALRVLLDEAKDYVEYQYRTIQDAEEKAGQVIRFDALVGGLVFAGISLLLRPGLATVGVPDAVLLGGALAALVASMVLASLALTRPNVAVGLNARRLYEALNYDLDPGAVRASAIGAYVESVNHNNERVVRPRARRLVLSLFLLVVSLSLLAAQATRLLAMGAHG